jgi:hypothetical protein
MAITPGHAHLHAIKILHHDKFLSPRQPVPRHCASAHLLIFWYRDNLSATYQNCTATLVMLNKICARTAKTRAIPSLHRDNLSAKVPGLCPVLASGNTTSLYCRAVIGKLLTMTVPAWRQKGSCFLDTVLDMTIFYFLSGLCPRAKILKFIKPHNWHICFCPISSSLCFCKSKRANSCYCSV